MTAPLDDQDGETLTQTVRRLLAVKLAPDDAPAVPIEDWTDFQVGDVVVQLPDLSAPESAEFAADFLVRRRPSPLVHHRPTPRRNLRSNHPTATHGEPMTTSATAVPVSVTVLLGTGETRAEIAHADIEVPATVSVTADAGVVVRMDDSVCNDILATVLEQIADEIRAGGTSQDTSS